MQNFSASPREMVASFWRNRGLIRNLVHREVVGRYKGSMLGIFWSLVTPIFMLAVYTFVFSVVFKARWSSGSESKSEFALVLFAGLLVFNLFSECISRAPGMVLANTNYVKKVVFPLEILPWVTLGSALFHFTVSLGVWLVAYFFLIGAPHWTALLLPLIILPFALFVMGLSWTLASLGVYLRDVGQFIGIMVQVLMFMTPIFYPASALPEQFQKLMFFNPLTPPIEMVREVMYWGDPPNILIWLGGVMVSLLTSLLGFTWFQKTRKGFADVL
ncbi:MAG: ABC transporter permease [Hydrogenophaga sp.]|uniref:ABC transporter permease n=1 Tax=Hydrogenophaga sp. TaxID=1904254 RepID=UPI002725FB94|nr:ABC transporter permease [Hydrogenophaga sp.]MDZ4058201.1 ABC transporter permease [Polynucleobacter sp.]MDO9482790.1 ABC transporter permease [Hydrogenophaga sp.]MDP3343993.1 ABC transporter permease [Hydrogenophaga sp.]MDP3807595.1 ABC transporter permease [Hydrogenophaga sp.]MDP3924748.1 ABC transporter permease [Hydrogenophaga sp.]